MECSLLSSIQTTDPISTDLSSGEVVDVSFQQRLISTPVGALPENLQDRGAVPEHELDVTGGSRLLHPLNLTEISLKPASPIQNY
jgi:hypothetical protein